MSDNPTPEQLEAYEDAEKAYRNVDDLAEVLTNAYLQAALSETGRAMQPQILKLRDEALYSPEVGEKLDSWAAIGEEIGKPVLRGFLE